MRKKLHVYLSVVSIALLIHVSLFSHAVEANEVTWTYLEDKVTYDVNKVWSITFTLPVDPQSINPNTIYLKDSNGDIVPTTLTSKDNIVDIVPVTSYEKNKRYTIYVGPNIKSLSGKTLTSNVQVHFTVEDELKGEQLKQAGTYGGTTANPRVYAENVFIKAADVHLLHAVIQGDLVIDAAVGEGNVDFTNVHVQGQTIINGGGGQKSVQFTDSTIKAMMIHKNNGSVGVVVHGKTNVDKVQMESPALLFETGVTSGYAGFTDVVLSEAIQNTAWEVTLQGDYVTVNSTVRNVRLTLPEASTIHSLALSAVANVVGTGMIDLLEASGNATGSTVEMRPQMVVLDIIGGVLIIGGESILESYTIPSSNTANRLNATVINPFPSVFIMMIALKDAKLADVTEKSTLTVAVPGKASVILTYNAENKVFLHANIQGDYTQAELLNSIVSVTKK